MPTLLVVTVGGSPAPVVHAIQQNHPAFTFFLCSTDPDPKAGSDRAVDGGADSIVAQAGLSPDAWAIERVGRAAADADDLGEILAACERVGAAMEARFGGGVDVVANYTGGTKTMALGLGIYALRAGERWSLQVAMGNRRDLVRVTAGDRAMPQSAGAVLAGEIEARAAGLAERRDYAGAVELLGRFLGRPDLPRSVGLRLHAVLTRYALLDARDRFDHGGALELAETDEGLRSEFRRPLRRILRAIELFEGQGAWPPSDEVTGGELVVDLLRNAEDCAARRRFDDAIGRLYRATELCAQVRLRRAFGIRSGDVDPGEARFSDGTRAWLERHRGHDGRVAIGLFASLRLLGDLGDPLGAYAREQGDALHGFLRSRNGSLFAHGLTPIGASDWRRTGVPWIAWLRGALARLDAPLAR